MTTASLVFAAALAAWGGFPAAASAPGNDAVDIAEAPPVQASPPPPVPEAPPVRQIFDEPALLATPARPARARPERPERARPARAPLYRDWRFWTISGGLFAAAVVTTILVTRPGPQPFEGNLEPKVITFP
jgi:hypothetical protein